MFYLDVQGWKVSGSEQHGCTHRQRVADLHYRVHPDRKTARTPTWHDTFAAIVPFLGAQSVQSMSFTLADEDYTATPDAWSKILESVPSLVRLTPRQAIVAGLSGKEIYSDGIKDQIMGYLESS